MIQVLLVDDHDLVRYGIRRLLDDVPGMRIVGEASSGEEAVKALRRCRPDVILMDVQMPGIGGLEATRRLLQLRPSVKIIIVSMHCDDPFPSRMLQAGAAGYLTKGCPVEEIVSAIRTVYEGDRYISAEIAQQLALTLLPGGSKSPFEGLSQRELQIMLMVTQGHKVQEISDRLCLSPKTVSTYRYRLFDKLGVHSDVELTHLAMRHGVIGRLEG